MGNGGCRRVFQREATAVQKEEMMCSVSKQMMFLCLREALDDAASGAVALRLPPAVDGLRTGADKLREHARDIRAQAESIGLNPAGETLSEADTEVPGCVSTGPSSRAASPLVNNQPRALVLDTSAEGAVPHWAGAASLLRKAASPSGRCATEEQAVSRPQSRGMDAEMARALMAGSLDSGIDGLQEPFKQIVKNILHDTKGNDVKYSVIVSIFEGAIAKLTFDKKLSDYKADKALKDGRRWICAVRGGDTNSAQAYDRCPSDAVSQWCKRETAAQIALDMQSALKDEIAAHPVTAAWAALLRKYSVAYGKAPTDAMQATNLCAHVCEEAVPLIFDRMAYHESIIRRAPTGRSKTPNTFAVCFSGEKLMKKHYRTRMT